jgi:excinuclease ABC subunit C
VTKVRLGLAGIDRVWPLRLSGDTPDSASRALGEARAVSSADRDGFLAQITALLNRDPAVVRRHRDLLIAERDRVARGLAYELAQRIQEELEGVDWLTQPQRMTGCTPADTVIHGWANGWLVSLSASHGRFNQWKVGQATADVGRGLAARTPPEWQAYAQANAELHAALATGFA